MKAWPNENSDYGKQWAFIGENDMVILSVAPLFSETLQVVSGIDAIYRP